MGKPFAQELKLLNSTYEWALGVNLSRLDPFISGASDTPLTVIGSGGSYSSAVFGSLLHYRTGHLSRAMTPLEAMSSNLPFSDCSVLMVSARGGNADVVDVFTHLAESEPFALQGICLQRNSRLSESAKAYQYAKIAEFDPPFVRDGFLATNSLLSFCVILTRALGGDSLLRSGRIHSLGTDAIDGEPMIRTIKSLADRRNWVILHDGWASPAAIDLESKLTEGALCSSQVADFRNFGHGRHYWLARHASDTGVVCLATSEEMNLANRTLKLIPAEIPRMLISSPLSGAEGGIDLLVQVFHVINVLSQQLGVDPGKPRVPSFGRRLYSLRIGRGKCGYSTNPVHGEIEAAAILRKARTSSLNHLLMEDRLVWKRALDEFIGNLTNSRFGTIVFDYDGTLCHTDERYAPLSSEIATWLNWILSKGIVIGVATGRGKSAGVAMREVIPRTMQERVLMGYYNGAVIASLADESAPVRDASPELSIQSVHTLLETSTAVKRNALIELRPKQISVQSTNSSLWSHTRQSVCEIARKAAGDDLNVWESGHSIDIVPKGVSKTNLVNRCVTEAANAGLASRALCIGDRGHWPGNDFELLSTQYSLSVHTVSSDEMTCWNLCPPGHRGVQGTLSYFGAMDADDGCLAIAVERNERGGARRRTR